MSGANAASEATKGMIHLDDEPTLAIAMVFPGWVHAPTRVTIMAELAD